MPINQKRFKCHWFWDYLMPFTKFWGLITSVVLCGVGVDILVHHHMNGLYIILATIGLFFLEITWIINLFLKVCINDENNKIYSYWEGILWIKEWRKTVIYVAFALALLAKPHNLWLATVAGIMLIILGVLHFLHHWDRRDRSFRKEPLLDNQDSCLERLENLDTDVIILPQNEIVEVFHEE